jgi:hypothetical protein
MAASSGHAFIQQIGVAGGPIIGQPSGCNINGKIPKNNNGIWECSDDTGASTGAPTDATYITQIANGTLTAEQALGALATGLLFNTTTTGVLSTYGGSGSVNNQFLRSINGSGAGTFAGVSVADLTFDPATQVELDAVITTATNHAAATTSVHGISNTADLLNKQGTVAADKVVVRDTDASPIANTQWQVKDTIMQSADTTGVEGRYISKTSLQLLDTANYNNASVTQPKMSIATTAGDANTLTLHDLISGAPNTSDVIQWNGTNWVPAAGGGGAGGGNEKTAATISTRGLGNITLSGEQTLDGITTSATRILVTDQITATQNGPYITGSGAWTRTTDADAGSEFTGNWNMFVLSGTRNAGMRCTLTNTGTVTLGATNITFSCDPGSNGLASTDYNTTTGVPRLVAGKIDPALAESFAQHTNLGASDTITVTARQMGIQSSGGAVDLTSNPQITTAGVVDGRVVELIGTHATNTVKLDNGTGLRLCGNTGSLVIGLNGEKPVFRYNTTLSVWEQIGCPSLQGAFNTGNTIVADLSRPLRISDAAGTSYQDLYVNSGKPIAQGTCNGTTCDDEHILPTGKNFIVYANDGTTERFKIAESTGNVTMGAGTLNDISVQVGKAANQSINNTTDTAIIFDTEAFDTNTFHDNVTQNTRITFLKAGKYSGVCRATWSGTSSSGVREFYIKKNGTTRIADQIHAATPSNYDTTYALPLSNTQFAANDYIELYGWQDSGGALNVIADNQSPICAFHKVN